LHIAKHALGVRHHGGEAAVKRAMLTGDEAGVTKIEQRIVLDHIGVESEPPYIAPARGPPLWEECGDAQMGDGVQIEPNWDMQAQATPDFEVDQRISW
jgi:hypothetical protein